MALKKPDLAEIQHIPLFAELPKFELARLLPELDWISVVEGQAITPDDGPYVYVVASGQVVLHAQVGMEHHPVMTLGPTGIFGSLGFRHGSHRVETAIAHTEALLIRISAAKLEEVFCRHSSFAAHFTQLLVNRFGTTEVELARVRRMVKSYAAEIWNRTGSDHYHEAAADTSRCEDDAQAYDEIAAAAVPAQSPGCSAPARKTGQAPPQRERGLGWERFRRLWQARPKWAAGVGVALTVWTMLNWATELNAVTHLSLTILAWAASTWVFSNLPDYAVAIGACLIYIITGLVAPNAALSGYADPTWFMILGVFGIGAGISHSGLLYRTALHILNWLPPTYRGQTLAMSLAGLLATPCLPSSNARVALAGPLAMEVSDALGFPRRSNGATGIGMSCLLGFGHMFYLFLNGTSSCLLVWGLLPPAVRQQIDWGFWLMTTLPLGLFAFTLSYLAILRLLPVSDKKELVSRSTLRAQIGLLGPLSRNEKVTLVVVLAVLCSFITDSYHGFHPAWSAILGFLFLASTGVVDRETVKKGIDWNFLLLFGALISLATVVRDTGVTEALTQLLKPVLTPFTGYPTLFLTLVGLLTVLLRLAIPWQPAVILMLITMIPLAEATGYSPFLIGLVTLAMSSPYFLPQQNTIYMTVHSSMEEAFDHRRIRRLAYVHTLIIATGILLSIPYWEFLGLVP